MVAVVGRRVLDVAAGPGDARAADGGGGAAPDAGRVVADAREADDDVAAGDVQRGRCGGRAAAGAPCEAAGGVGRRGPRLGGALLEGEDDAGADVGGARAVPRRVRLGAVVDLVPGTDLHGAEAVAGAGGPVGPFGDLGPAGDGRRDVYGFHVASRMSMSPVVPPAGMGWVVGSAVPMAQEPAALAEMLMPRSP